MSGLGNIPFKHVPRRVDPHPPSNIAYSYPYLPQSYPPPVMVPYVPVTAVATFGGTSYYHPVSLLVQPYPPTGRFQSALSPVGYNLNRSFPQYRQDYLEDAQDPDYVDMSQMRYVPAPEHPDPKQSKLLDIHMGVDDLYRNIQKHLALFQECRVSWLNRLLAKCESSEDFSKAIEIFNLYQLHGIETTPETGTLLIKSACRAGNPEKSLSMLKDVEGVKIWPTLGGIHYLMINFSLRRDTQSVVETYKVTKMRNLKPNSRTFHILIRECVDNNLIEEAMSFHEECKRFDIVPNRVTYNILMNGYRKFGKPQQILELREEMDKNDIEINDTTVKFTVLAHLMQNDTQQAVDAFKKYPDWENKLEEFANKFFEVTEEDAQQENCLVNLFDALVQQGVQFPQSVKENIQALKESSRDQIPS